MFAKSVVSRKTFNFKSLILSSCYNAIPSSEVKSPICDDFRWNLSVPLNCRDLFFNVLWLFFLASFINFVRKNPPTPSPIFPPVILSRVTTSSQGKIFQSSAGSRKENCGRIKRRGGSSQREVDWKIHNPPSTLSNHSFPLKRFRHKKLDVLTIEWKMSDDAWLISHWGLVWQDWSKGKSCPGQLETAHIAKNAALQEHFGISPMNGSRV